MNNILNMKQYNEMMEKNRFNGRVDVLTEDPDTRFKMFEKISKRNRSTEYGSALDGIWDDLLYGPGSVLATWLHFN